MILALEHELLPGTLHAAEPSPHIAWQGSGLKLLQKARPWARHPSRPRRAGVSSFGISGTNAHVMLEEPPLRSEGVFSLPVNAAGRTSSSEATSSVPVLLPGRDDKALRAQAARWAQWLKAHPATDRLALLRTAAMHGTHFDARAAIEFESSEQAQEALEALGEGRPHGGVSVGAARALGGVVFVFAGHGSQWRGMGRAMLDESPVFCEAIEACDRALT